MIDGVSDSAGVYVPNGMSATIKNSATGYINNQGTALTVEESTVNGGSQSTFNDVNDSGSLDVESSNLYGGGHIVLCYSNCTVQNSWLHDNYQDPSAHQNGILADGGSNNTFNHNSVYCVGGCTGDISLLLNDGTQMNETVSSNLLVASQYAAYCAYPGPNYSSAPHQVSGITWQNNVFQKGSNNQCANFGPDYGWFPSTCSPSPCTWTGNMWSDGTALKP